MLVFRGPHSPTATFLLSGQEIVAQPAGGSTRAEDGFGEPRVDQFLPQYLFLCLVTTLRIVLLVYADADIKIRRTGVLDREAEGSGHLA